MDPERSNPNQNNPNRGHDGDKPKTNGWAALPVALLVVLAVGMATVGILTWGSIGSMAMVFCLILMGLSQLYQHFITNRDDEYFVE